MSRLPRHRLNLAVLASSRRMVLVRRWAIPLRSRRSSRPSASYHPDRIRVLSDPIKANIGHLEAAAGVTGLIKAVLALRHEAVPPQVHFSKLNPHISLAGTRLSVPTALTPWPSSSLPRCAAVSSFGIGGTNANVIVEEAPRIHADAANERADAARILTLSAQSPAALRTLAQSWITFLTETSGLRRRPVLYRLGATHALRYPQDCGGRTVKGGTEGPTSTTIWIKILRLSQRLHDGPRQRRLALSLRLADKARNGMPWAVSCLQSRQSSVRSSTTCDALLRPLSGWSLLQELDRSEESTRLDQTEVAQPALFAVQVALAALWKSWGVSPERGHRPQPWRDRSIACGGRTRPARGNSYCLASRPNYAAGDWTRSHGIRRPK